MNKLTLPPSGTISLVIHISDIHIKLGDVEKSRYNEYVSVFNTLGKMFSNIPQVQQGSAICIFTGDFFHYKNKLDSISVRLFNLLIDTITKQHIPLYIIQGNHDFLQTDGNIPDVISSLLYGNTNRLVNYIEKSGTYLANNVGFGFVSVKDILKIGDGTGYVEQLPTFPCGDDFPSSVTTKIALCHASFNNATFYNGMQPTHGLPIQWITSQGYNIGLFGDIHKTQIHPTDTSSWKNSFVYGYAGSLLQLDFGEEPLGHGFLMWDLVDQTVTHHEVPSPSKSLYMTLNNDLYMCYLDRRQTIPLKDINLDNVSHLYIKFKGNLSSTKSDELSAFLTNKNISHNITKNLTSIQFNANTEIPNTKTTYIDISQYNSQEMWIKYIEEQDTEKKLNNIPWKDWINNPSTILLSNIASSCPELKSVIKDRDKTINSLIDEFEANINQIQNDKKKPFCIRLIEWDYILCYGPNNYFNFDNTTRQICVINGVNSGGKTSFLETIAYGLYGEEFPSRKSSSNSSCIICDKKPTGSPSQITITFSLGDDYYKISRVLKPHPQNPNNIAHKKITLCSVSPVNGSILETITTTKSEVDNFVEKNIGTFQDFIMSCLITQLSDADFFNLKNTEQLKLLDDTLHLNCIEDMMNIIKNTMLGLNALSKHCDAFKKHVLSDIDTHKGLSSDEIDKLIQLIETKRTTLNDLKIKCDEITDTWHNLDKNDLLSEDSVISANIEKYKRLVSKFKLDEDLTLLTQQKAVLSDKINSLNLTSIQCDYSDESETKLKQLETKIIIKPQYDPTYYNNKIDTIKKWRTIHQDTLALTSTHILEKIKETTDKLQKLNDNIATLFDQKPNQPEITSIDYDVFLDHVRDINQTITNLDNNINSIETLEKYCETHPLPIITHNKDLIQLQTELSTSMAKISDPSWENISLQELEKLLSIKQAELNESHTLHDKIHSQIEKLEKTITDLFEKSKIIDINISKIGTLNKPYIPNNDVSLWLKTFKQMREDYSQQNQNASQLEQELDKNTQIYNQYTEYDQKITLIVQELDNIEHQNFPFNPKCEACQKQPWKLRQLQLTNEKRQISTWLQNHTKPTNIDTIRQQICVIREWIDKYNQHSQSFELYQTMEKDWEKYNHDMEQLNVYGRDKCETQRSLEQANEKRSQLLKEIKTLDNTQKTMQTTINNLQYVINNIPQWTHLQNQINDIVTYQKNKHIHEIYQSYSTIDFKYYTKQKQLLDMTEKWKFEHDSNKKQITEHNKLLGELQQQLTIIEENARQTDTENECLKNLTLLSEYDEHNQQLTALKKCIYLHKLSAVDDKMIKISKGAQFSEKLLYWENIASNKPLFAEKLKINKKIERLYQDINDLSIDLEKNKTLFEIYHTNNEHIKQYDSLLDLFDTRYNALEFLHKLMSNFRMWLYTNIIIPQITHNINEITSIVTQCNDFSLKGIVNSKNKTIDINWFINSPSGLSTIGKSGGFRKYIYGLIMRISLTRMGCSRINNKQLFIDEGFTSADTYNLDKMCEFLSNLTDFFPNGIIIASHLQPIKDCGDIAVQLEKNQNMTSRINYGNEHLITQTPQTPQTPKKIIGKIKITAKKPSTTNEDNIPLRSNENNQPDECIAFLKNGKKCGKPTKLGQPYCGRHITVKNII
jgi:DNA repair exonuclease SbcCD ATPase subunit